MLQIPSRLKLVCCCLTIIITSPSLCFRGWCIFRCICEGLVEESAKKNTLSEKGAALHTSCSEIYELPVTYQSDDLSESWTR